MALILVSATGMPRNPMFLVSDIVCSAMVSPPLNIIKKIASKNQSEDS